MATTSDGLRRGGRNSCRAQRTGRPRDAADSARRTGPRSPGLDIRPPYDPAAARALLDKFGYRDRHGDGWRVLHIGTTPEDRERDDLFRKNLRAIGVRVEFVNRRWVDSPRWRSKASCRSARQSAALGVGDEQARIRGNSVRPIPDQSVLPTMGNSLPAPRQAIV